jgi:hypothetical protein
VFGRGGDDGVSLFQMQQAALAPEAAAVATQFTAFIHNAVAGNHDGDAVETVGTTDGADSGAIAKGDCDVFIRPGLPVRNLEEFALHPFLEVGAGRDHRH